MRAVIHQAGGDEQRLMDVVSLNAALSLLKSNEFTPTLVVDVGANHGNWALETHRAFPSAEFFLVDGDPANKAYLEKVCGTLPRSRFSISLLGAEPGEERRFYQMGTGSSILAERTDFDRSVLTLPMTTLDELLSADESETVLLKLDVQGYELEVLRGARKLLSRAQVVISECSLIQYNDGAPLFDEVVFFMKERGFVVYDFCGQMRREKDGALFQTDVVFVKEGCALRTPFSQWTPA
jgi:FkbM family methyltransferase